MKNLLATISLLILSQSAFSADFIEMYKSFEGEYELIGALAERSPNLITRGSRCRDTLAITYSDDYQILRLSSQNIERAGMTLNWIDAPSSDNETSLESDSVVQNRYNVSKIFGVKKKSNMITSLSREGDQLRLQYTASTETSFKTFIEAESICIYQKI